MRQAGRYLEIYRKVRAKHDVLTICKTPELSASLTIDAAKELGVDAAIMFADIMLPLEGAGIALEIVDKMGPLIDNPVRDEEQLDRIAIFVPEEHVPHVLDAIRLVKSRLEDSIPLIGFSGAPFTLASYLIEGGPSRDFTETKKLMYSQPNLWTNLLNGLSKMVSNYLRAQTQAGVDAVQLFDSWAGCLSPSDYEQFVLPYTKRVFEQLQTTGLPLIHFGVGTAGLLKTMGRAGADVYGVDWRVPIDEAWETLGSLAIQGNLDPATVLGTWDIVEARTHEILKRIAGRPGHVFNLGHGVLPETQPEQLKRLVRFVHDATRKRG
jgi:uroporphyrinogen decarboxylase